MRRACLFLLGLLVCSAQAAKLGDAFRQNVEVTVQSVTETLQHIGEEVQQHYAEASEGYQKVLDNLRERRGEVAAALGAGSHRRLHTLGGAMENVQGFLEDMMGKSWADFVPSSWSSPSFNWGTLGEFDYNSNLADFMSHADLKNVTDIKSLKDLHQAVDFIENAFCKNESYTPSAKKFASCTGPSVTIAVTPKSCVLEAATKQIVCEPAKLVLTKTPGSCTHKHLSSASWAGKVCKLSGGAGFADSVILGGGNKTIPLTQVDLSYTYK